MTKVHNRNFSGARTEIVDPVVELFGVLLVALSAGKELVERMQKNAMRRYAFFLMIYPHFKGVVLRTLTVQCLDDRLPLVSVFCAYLQYVCGMHSVSFVVPRFWAELFN